MYGINRTTSFSHILGNSIIAAVALGVAAPVFGQCPPPGPVYAHSKFITSNFRVSWSICGTDLAMRMQVVGTGWMAVAFNASSSNGHSGADSAMGRVVVGVPTVEDHISNNHSAPILDPIQNITLSGGGESLGVSTIDFRRPLIATEPNDFTITAGPHPLHWAIGPNDTMTQQHATKGSVSLDLFSTAFCRGDINGDNTVNIDDLLNVINNWGATGLSPADVTDDLVVNIDDLLGVINGWGTCS